MRLFMTLVALMLAMTGVQAKVKLPHILSDNMILQQNSEVRLWGWDKPGTQVEVSVSWSAQKYASKTGKDGKWTVSVKTPATLHCQLPSMMERRQNLTAFFRARCGFAPVRVIWKCPSRDSATAL